LKSELILSFFRIHEATGLDLKNDVYDLLGYDDIEKRVR
jgi:hypothetical protein